MSLPRPIPLSDITYKINIVITLLHYYAIMDLWPYVLYCT